MNCIIIWKFKFCFFVLKVKLMEGDDFRWKWRKMNWKYNLVMTIRWEGEMEYGLSLIKSFFFYL